MSTELILAIVLTVIAALIGAAVTIAMDAKTKGEARFAMGCFIFAGLVIIAMVGVWDVNTLASFPVRALASVLIALVSYGTFEAVRWTHNRHVRASTGEAIPKIEALPQPKSDALASKQTTPIQAPPPAPKRASSRTTSINKPTPLPDNRRPAVVRITNSEDGEVKGVRGYGDIDGVVVDHSSNIKVTDVQVVAPSSSKFEELKARINEHAGFATKIKKDFVWYRKQMALASSSDSDIERVKKVEKEFKNIASDRNATLALLQKLRPVLPKK
jgi:hypothetical protein